MSEELKESKPKKLCGKGFADIKAPLTKNKRKVLFYSDKKYEVEKGYKPNIKFVRAIENTSIYKDTEKLALIVHNMVYNIPKIDRLTFWDKLYKLCLDLIGYFNMAYSFEEKRVKFIDKYFENLNIIISLLRFGSKAKIVHDKQYIATFEIIESIDNAIKLYKKDTLKKQNVQNQ